MGVSVLVVSVTASVTENVQRTQSSKHILLKTESIVSIGIVWAGAGFLPRRANLATQPRNVVAKFLIQ